MILGLRTTIYPAPDLARAKAWYRQAFQVAPYFDEPFYVGFTIGGCELGLDPAAPPAPAAGGTVAYWGVDQLDQAYAHFIALGATAHEAPHAVGGDITVASVRDPFGNIIGLIRNPHFDPAQVR